MDFQGIVDRLRAAGVSGILSVEEPREKDTENKEDKGRAGESYVLLDPKHLIDFFFSCRDDEALHFEQLVDLYGTDPGKDDESYWVGYQLLSVKNRHRLAIKCQIPKSNPAIESATAVYAAARWHEREAGEMYGIEFLNHPDPRNILLPDDWVGHPLRKDYEFPKEYHGISCE